jgi:hypothetical protein
VLVKSANSANVTIESQFETMKVAAPIFAIFGDNLEQVAALTAAMGNAGIKGSQGATALKNAILRLAAPTPKVSAGMHTLGLSIDDISKVGKDGKRNMKPMTEILKTMGPLLKKLGTKDQAAVLDQIFGKRAIAAIGNLTGVIDNVQKFETVLKDAGGTAKQTAEVMRKSLGNRIKTLQSAAIEMGFKFLDAFKSDGVDGITALTKAIREFDISPIIKGLKLAIFLIPKIIKGFILWKVAMNAIIIKQKIMIAVGWIKYLFLMRTAIIAATAMHWLQIKAMVAQKAALIGSKAVMIGATVITKAWAAAQWLVNAAMSANPIGLIVVAIAAVIAGIVRLISMWDELVLTFKKDGFFAALGKFFGIGGSKKIEVDGAGRAPNSAENVAQQNVNVSGTIGVQGPAGTTVEKGKNSAPGVNMQLLGAQ